MSVTAITSQTIVLAGLKPTYAAANASGSTIVNTGRTFLACVNAGSAATTVTVDSLVVCNQGTDHDAVVSVTGATTRMIGPFPIGRFNDASGNAAVSFSSVTDLTVAALELA